MKLKLKLKWFLGLMLGTLLTMANTDDGQKKYDQGLYREAFEIFDKNHSVNKAEDSYVKALQSQLMLKEFENTLKKAIKAPKFKDRNWSLMHKIIYVKAIEKFLDHYSGQLPADELKGETEPIKRTRDYWLSELKKSARDLAGEDKTLLAIKLEEMKMFFYFKDIDIDALPTVYDWVVEEMYSNTFWGGDKAQKVAVIQKALAGKEKNRSYVRDYWRMQLSRLNTPFNDYLYFDPGADPLPAGDESVKAQIARFKDVHGQLETSRGRGEWKLVQSKFYIANRDIEKGLSHCHEAIDTYKGPSTSECLNIIAQIENHDLALLRTRFNSKSELKIPVMTRNLAEIFVKVYPIENKNIDDNFEFLKNSNREPLSESTLKALLNRKPKLSKSFKLKPKNIYLNFSSDLNLGTLEPGLYQLVLSDADVIDSKKSFVVGADIRVSDIQLVYQFAGKFDPEQSLAMTSPQIIPTHNFYVFDSSTGTLLSDIPLKSQLNGAGDQISKTDKNGSLVFDDSWDFQHDRGISKLLSVAQLNNSVSTFRNDYIVKPSFQSAKMVIDLDRPIFRPGQKVNIKATALRRIPFGYRVISNTPIKVKIMNPQYQLVFEKTFQTNAQGSIHAEFELPLTGMVGQYNASFEIDSAELREKGIARTFNDYFSVEEYKRPDYFVDIEKAKDAWVFGRDVKIKVSAKYYYGAPVKKGRIHYSIRSEVFNPWYIEMPVAAVAASTDGEAVLDEKGEFLIPYTPKADGTEARRYVVTANVFDESGRSISGNGSYRASLTEFMIHSVASKDFFKSTERPSFVVKLEDLNGALFSGSVDYDLFELLPPSPLQKAELKTMNSNNNPRGYHFGDIGKNNFQRFFEKLATKPLLKGVWGITKEKFDFYISALPEGVYKLKLSTKDSFSQAMAAQLFFIVADTGTKLSSFYIPEITLLSKNEYKIGEIGTVLFGSSELSGHMVGFLMKSNLYLDNPVFKTTHGIKVYDFKVTESMFNGSSFNWFSVYDNEAIQGRQMITVNNDYKKLDVHFEKGLKVKPGQWGQLRVKNSSNSGELDALLAMYDQSLELYARRDQDHLKSLYQNIDYSAQAQIQYEYLNSFTLEWVPPDLKSLLETFKKNTKFKYRPLLLIDADRLRQENDYSLSLDNRFESGGGGRSLNQKSFSLGAMAVMAPAEMPSFGENTKVSKDSLKGEPSPRQESNDKSVDNRSSQSFEIRKNFAETAVFNPFFNISKESAKFDFKAPDQLTAWKAKLVAISADGKVGQDEQIIVSQKDFFVRVLVTRYLREGDLTEIKLKVDNRTQAKLLAELSLDMDGKDLNININDLFKGQSLKQTVEVLAESSYTKTWKLKVPSAIGAIKIRGIAVVDKEMDAEEKTISILPSRQRLIENSMVYLKNKQTTLTLNNWGKKDSTRINELVSLQIDPQLPIMLLNSIPSLVNYPYNCTEQIISKYVPLAIVSSLYTKNPKLKDALADAFKKNGPRKTLTLPWEEKDPRRLLELTETPWMAGSQGMTSPYELISFLDSVTIEKIKTEVFRDLKTRQTEAGGFSWFPGGRDDIYITLVALEALSEAAFYGVDFPKDLFEKGLNYIYGELPKYMKAHISELQFLIYGTYVFTSFDTKLKNLSHNKQITEVWIPFIEKHATLLTPLGHAYMAHIYKRLGKNDKSEISLKRALDGSKKDDLMGIYWTPEERSWMWYSDTVEKQAFLLQTLIQLKPQDDRIDGLVQWLLFNRKGNEWKSTKTTTKAIFSLMHYLREKTNFTEQTNLAIEWGSRKETMSLDPLSVAQKEPLRFAKTEKFMTEDGKVKISKMGSLPIFAGLTWIYTSDTMTSASGSSVMDLKREFYKVRKNSLEKLALGDRVAIGDEIEVLLTIKSKSEINYVHLKDPRGAGFESNALLSGYRWDRIGRYEEARDSLMNFFFESVPKGEYLMRHRFKATTPGIYRFNSATIQSMYAPEMTAYSSTFQLEVLER